MNLNGKQIIGIIGAILSALMISTAQLTDLFGSGVAKAIISAAGLGNLMIQSITVAISGQGSLVKDVAAMTGVEPIRINANANQTLAQLATDPLQPKIGALPEAKAEVTSIATGASI